ncbi:MAG: hypothetical protein U1E65_33805 [Myxococcota bacterium]
MKNVPPPSALTVRTYDAIALELGRLGIAKSTMFGMPTLKREGKAVCGLFGDAMVFKLDGDAHAAALKLAGVERFDPSGKGRPMKAWLVVPKSHAARWPALAMSAAVNAPATAEKKKTPAKAAPKAKAPAKPKPKKR